MQRSRVLSILIACVVTVGASAACQAKRTEPEAGYPSEPITFIVPFSAGGPADLAARALAPAMERELGQSLVVENVEGASGARGMQELTTKGEPDGYTIEIVASSAAVVNPLVQDVGYTEKDFEMVGGVAVYPYFIVVPADSPYASAEEFFAAAKAAPGTIKIGTPGATTQPAIQMKRLASEQGVEITPVPFNGNSELVTALLGHNVDGIFVVTSDDILSQIDAGKFRAVAVGSEEPVDYLPGVPTFGSLGYPELSGASYNGIAVQAGTPAPVKQKLEAALEKSLGDPEVLRTIGDKYVADEFVSGAELTDVFAQQRAEYGPILKQN
jgi:putative tricarboxylic transport membrane protein